MPKSKSKASKKRAVKTTPSKARKRAPGTGKKKQISREEKKAQTKETRQQKKLMKALPPKRKTSKRSILIYITAKNVHITINDYAGKEKAKKQIRKKKKPLIKKNDKSAAFFNTQQRRFITRVEKFINTLSRKKRKEFMEFVQAEAQKNGGDKAVEKIGNESMFMTYVKHLSKKQEIKNRMIVGFKGDNIVVIKKFQQLYDLRAKNRSVMTFYPVTNTTLYEFPKD